MPVNREVPPLKSPYRYALIGNATFTLGAEASNARNIVVQLKTPRGMVLPKRGYVHAYLSSDANGDFITQVTPDSVVAGASGTILPNASAGDGLSVVGLLAIDATATKFKTTQTATFSIGGQILTKVATTAVAFTAAHVVSPSLFGTILIQVNAAGTISTKVPLATQAYASAALALAALSSPDAGNVALGYFTIAAAGGGFTANTTALTGVGVAVDGSLTSTVSRRFIFRSDATGLVNVIITTAIVVTYYLVILLPDGSQVVSAPISFV